MAVATRVMGWVFLTLLLVTVVLAIRHGGREEHVVLCALLVSYVGTMLSYKFIGEGNWLTLNWGVWGSDVLCLGMLVLVAMRTKKWWPFLIAGLQILPVFMPVVALTGQNLISEGLGRTQGIWAYPQLATLILASLSFKSMIRPRSSPA